MVDGVGTEPVRASRDQKGPQQCCHFIDGETES